jgi:threonine synthase
MGETVNVTVPTGNFGNILAAYYAKHMGLPIGKLICASNVNNVLTDFIKTGTYDRNRPFHMTASPSMDILISSNLERLLSALYGSDEAVAGLMNELKETGVYTVSDEVREKLQAEFYGGFCDEEKTNETIRSTYTDREYLMDTHTAVGYAVCEEYREKTGDNAKTIVVSTASPYKFAESILFALRGVPCDEDEFEQAEMLSQLTRTKIHAEILALRGKSPRFTTTCERDGMEGFVTGMLGV